MRILTSLHRRLGGMAGLVRALLGLSGAALVWRGALVMVPHAHDALQRDPANLARVTMR